MTESLARLCLAISFLVGLLPWDCAPARAQMTIFNVPSADVTPARQLFVENEAQFRFWRPERYYLGTQYGAVGVGHNTEIDATLFNFQAPPTRNITLGLGFKTAWPIPILRDKLPALEPKVIFGQMLPISLENHGAGDWTYGMLSARVPGLRTRITGGVSFATRQIFFQNGFDALLAFEQPIGKRLTLLGDWISGTNFYSVFITGVSYSLPRDTTIYAGWSIPNTNAVGQQYITVELSKFFHF